MTQRKYCFSIRGVSWFASTIALAVLLTACGGGSEDNQPPLTSAASLAGSVTFTAEVPLATPPGDAFDGPVPEGIRYGARIVDPGDNIGHNPIPKPTKLTNTGGFEFTGLLTNPVAYFNLRFTVDDNLEEDGSTRTPISFNIPVSLLDGIATLLSANIHRPSDSVLEMTYTYRGPDGSRAIRLRLDFETDLITFDLDSDGLYDDLIAIDTNHDAIPDGQAPFIEDLELADISGIIGTVSGVGSNSIIVNGKVYQVWGHTNLTNTYNNDPVTLSEVSIGTDVEMRYVAYSGENVAVKIGLKPDPSDPDVTFDVKRDGLIESINSAAIFVGGISFQDYASATIEDINGHVVMPAELEAGMYVSVIGEREFSKVIAENIIIKEVSPPSVYIERLGPIEALDPPEAPTLITVDGITFIINAHTVITDLGGATIDTSFLIVGNPVWVFGHEEDSVIYANFIEIQYEIEVEPVVPEIAILINDAAALPDVYIAIELVDSEIQITPLVVASHQPAIPDPPCIDDAFEGLFWAKYMLMGLPGYIEAFPYVDEVAEECRMLILIEDGYPDTEAWVVYLFPGGIGGALLDIDLVALPPFYGAGQDMIDALEVAEALSDELWSNDSVVSIYISPDVGFSNDD